MDPQNRYIILRLGLLLSISVLAFAIPVYAAIVFTTQTTGHITIVNGTNAGVTITPSFLDFGSITWGSIVTKPMTVKNTGDCIENVMAVATQASQSPVILNILSLTPGHSLDVTATYDTSQFSSPGDYTFTLDWTATCL